MKRIYVFLVACLCCLITSAQELTVGSYFINCRDASLGNQWTTCRKSIANQINWQSPDIFGTQELTRTQVVSLHSLLDGYEWIGVGADDGQEQGKHTAVFYRPERVQLMEQGHFWLCETPDEPSKGWDAATIRLCTWGLFRDRHTGQSFYFLNLQMDDTGTQARSESAKLVMQRLAQLTGDGAKPAIVAGAFHIPQGNTTYKLFTDSGVLKDCYTAAAQRFAENGTDNKSDYHLYTDQRIDHIFVTAQATVNAYAIITDGYWTTTSGNARHTLSTHYPVFARVAL